MDQEKTSQCQGDNAFHKTETTKVKGSQSWRFLSDHFRSEVLKLTVQSKKDARRAANRLNKIVHDLERVV